ncbi:MAG: GAF domain-containing protein [Caldisericia bacterium]|nr:GAF domain-containing protein [Caldisericia bacterium]
MKIKDKYKRIFDTISETISAGIVWRYTLSDVVFDIKTNLSKYDWVGIYLSEGNELKLETFLGQPTEHTSIEIAKGVCGEAADKKITLIVDDVHGCDNYLSCNIKVKSEIVVPIIRNGEVLGVIDIDSHIKSAFIEEDKELLEMTAAKLAAKAPIILKTKKTD